MPDRNITNDKDSSTAKATAPASSQKPAGTKKSSSKFDLMSIYCYVALVAAAAWLAYSLPSIFAIIDHFKAGNPEYPWPKHSEFIWVLYFAVLISVTRSIFVRLFTSSVKKILKECPERDVRAKKVTDALFKVIFYISIVAWAWILFKDTEFLGPELGGNGDFKKIWKDFPYYSYPDGLTIYYMFSMAYHAQSLFFHVFVTEKRNDYLEMLLHHTVTCFLIYLSFILNYVRVGVCVTFVHDISDIFIYGAKFLVDLKWEQIQIPYYISLMTAFAWTRLFVYPFYIIKWGAYYSQEMSTVEIRGRRVATVMLCMLLVLHIYWYSILVKIGISKIYKGKRMEDEFCKIDPKEMNKNKATQKVKTQ